jgi:hypothetical protein
MEEATSALKSEVNAAGFYYVQLDAAGLEDDDDGDDDGGDDTSFVFVVVVGFRADFNSIISWFMVVSCCSFIGSDY